MNRLFFLMALVTCMLLTFCRRTNTQSVGQISTFSQARQTHESNGTNETNGANEPIDTSKRSFLLSSALLATAAMAQNKDKIMDGGLAEIEDKVAPERQTPIMPPGSQSKANFEKKCTGCQLCISECPNEVLRPSADLWLSCRPQVG